MAKFRESQTLTALEPHRADTDLPVKALHQDTSRPGRPAVELCEVLKEETTPILQGHLQKLWGHVLRPHLPSPKQKDSRQRQYPSQGRGVLNHITTTKSRNM